MPTLAKIRRCVYPFPVYEAHFNSGKTLRMSFHSPAGKPIDASLGRILFTKYDKGLGALIDGYTEHSAVGRTRDPHFAPMATQRPGKRRVTVKQAKDALASLLDVIDGGRNPTDEWPAQARLAVEAARQLVAA